MLRPVRLGGTTSLTRPLRVALVTPSLHPGGAERQMLYLAATLPRDVFEVRFVVLWEGGSLAREAARLSIPVHVLGLDRDACRRFTPRCLPDMMSALRSYLRLTREVDVVDAWLVPAYTFAGMAQPFARVPVLIAGRRSVLDVPRTRTWYREAAGAFAMRHADSVVANSQAAADQAALAEGIDPTRIHVIRNAVAPVAVSDAQRSRARQQWGFVSQDLVAGCVGNFKPGKGQQLLLEVAADLHGQYPHLRFVFVGDGPLRPWLEGEIHRRDLDGVVVLHSGEADARWLYGAFDMAVQASDSEGLPNAVLEAAAAGLPIVATAVGGTEEILTAGEDGLLVEKGDRRGLGEAVGRLAQDGDLRRSLGLAAQRRSQVFSPARLAEETGSLYLRLAASRGRRGRR